MKKDKNTHKAEIRTTPGSLAIREATREDGTTEESRTITGTAIVFNEDSRVMDGFGEAFVETIKPEAASASFLKTQDIKLNLLHERESTIGRCNRGQGNLKLSVDEKGVSFELDVPKCDLGDRALALVRAGVYSGCSFEFYPKDYTTEEIDDGNGGTITRITHTKFAAITALTIAMDPAYSQTEVDARELREHTPQAAERRELLARKLQREHEIAEAEAYLRESEIQQFDNF